MLRPLSARLALALALLSPASARAELRPLLGEPEPRWTFGPLAIESAPLVAGERVLVAGREPTGRRALVVLDLASGRVLSRTLFHTSDPLAPAASGERVAVRSNPQRVDVYRLRGARPLAERSVTLSAPGSEPRLEGDQLLVRDGAELASHALVPGAPEWRARVPGAFHGAPAVLGEHVFAGWYTEDGGAHLAWIERATGRGLGNVMLGRHASGTPSDARALRVVAHRSRVFVGLGAGIRATSGADLAWSRVPFDGSALGSPTLHDLLADPLELGALADGSDGGWVAPERTRAGATRWILTRPEPGNLARERAIELAAPEHHAWLVARAAPAARAGDVLYIGPCAADARSLDVLWRRETPGSRHAPVPFDGGVLVVEGDRLVALGSQPLAADAERERARERVADLERGLGGELARIAAQALRASDGELAARLVEEAAALGANERALAPLRAQAARAPAQPAGARSDQRRAALLAEEDAARAKVLSALAEAARAARAPREKRALLAELFAREPAHAAGVAELARLLPAGARVEDGEPRAWLGLLDVADALPLSVVAAAGPGAPSPEQERLREEREEWRPDALGYQSPRLFVVTAATAPDAVARTMRSGELVCDVLEQVFGGARPAAERLELLLYPTQDEYIARSGGDLGGLESVLGFTAGHFDLGARVSRLFLPEGDDDGSRLLGVSAHELTHHWLATRSRFGPPRAAKESAGFWVVEGIATWAEELRLDPARGTWSSAPARAASLDTLVNAAPGDLVPWRELLESSFERYTKLETRPTCSLALDWRLGAHAPRSPMQLFYAQGAALAHWLYDAENGARRALLLRAVEAYYRGEPLDVAKELATTPEELGNRVRAWALALARPPER